MFSTRSTRIIALEKAVGTSLYRNALHGKAEHSGLIKDVSTKHRVLQILESALRGIDRLRSVTKRLDPKTLESLLGQNSSIATR